ncbi:MAG: hypothetical protein WC758_08510 [Candidatus Woesearchaeota archaeon]|jgi:hypothetical protein
MESKEFEEIQTTRLDKFERFIDRIKDKPFKFLFITSLIIVSLDFFSTLININFFGGKEYSPISAYLFSLGTWGIIGAFALGLLMRTILCFGVTIFGFFRKKVKVKIIRAFFLMLQLVILYAWAYLTQRQFFQGFLTTVNLIIGKISNG